MADPVPGAADRLAAACGGAAYADAGRMLDAERVEAVYVCVPPFAHGGPERAALDRGLPLFVEKPLATDAATAEALAGAVAAAGVPTAVGCHWRCLDTVAAAACSAARRPAPTRSSRSATWRPAGWWRAGPRRFRSARRWRRRTGTASASTTAVPPGSSQRSGKTTARAVRSSSALRAPPTGPTHRTGPPRCGATSSAKCRTSA